MAKRRPRKSPGLAEWVIFDRKGSPAMTVRAARRDLAEWLACRVLRVHSVAAVSPEFVPVAQVEIARWKTKTAFFAPR